MIGYKLDKAKSMFFDRKTVLSSVDRATRRVLSKFGAYVRTSAKSSIRKRKKVSDPGRPPSSRTGLLKKYIFFAYDGRKQSVVIGPVRLNTKYFDRDVQPKTGLVPEVLEYGGSLDVIERKIGPDMWVRRDLRRRGSGAIVQALAEKRFVKANGVHHRRRTVRVAPRPYMGPALEREKPKLPAMWAGSIN